MRKKYVVSTGVYGVDDRRALETFDDLKLATIYASNQWERVVANAITESQQVHYRKSEFTQFLLGCEEIIYDDNDKIIGASMIFDWATPKYRYGRPIDEHNFKEEYYINFEAEVRA